MCQTSLDLAQEAQLIGLWGPPSMCILLEAVCVCVVVCVCVCVRTRARVCVRARCVGEYVGGQLMN